MFEFRFFCVRCAPIVYNYSCVYLGGAHFPVGLEPLALQLKKVADEANAKAKNRKAELETLLKHCKQALAEHDKETEQLMDQIKTRKNKQVCQKNENRSLACSGGGVTPMLTT